MRHLYVHVPFCAAVCPFCSFHVVTRRGPVVERYLTRLDTEAARAATAHPTEIHTIYLGGGTPSILSAAEIEALLTALRHRFPVDDHAEITLEAHPTDVSPTAAATWRDLGVTRLSVGVQSFDDDALGRLGRHHDGADGRRALDHALDAGFPVVGADIITAIPGHDPRPDLAAVAASGVNHVSAYTLTIEPGTPFQHRGVEVDPDAEAAAHDVATRVLGAAGLRRYEASNHAGPGAECRHNQAYWRNDWWLGLGPSASAHVPPSIADGRVAERVVHPRLDRWLAGDTAEPDPVDVDTFVVETLLAGLRTARGVDLADRGRRADAPLPARVVEGLGRAVAHGWLQRHGDRVTPTDEGIALHNRVIDLIM